MHEERYSIVVDFYEGCQVEFFPSDGDFELDKKARDTVYPYLVGASQAHERAVLGSGVTVAIVDTGLWSKGGGEKWALPG